VNKKTEKKDKNGEIEKMEKNENKLLPCGFSLPGWGVKSRHPVG